MTLSSQALGFIKRCQRTPFLFEDSLLGPLTLSKDQKKIHQYIMDPKLKEVWIHGCHASGKTRRIARSLVSLFYIYGPCKIFTLMPTGRQTKYAIWSEIHNEYNQAKSPLGGTLLTQELKVNENWFMLGFSTKDPNMARSFHAPRVIIMIDEAQGVEDPIFTAIDGILSGGWTKLICAGNPVSTVGRYKKECLAGNTPYKKVFHIDAETQENVLAKKDVIPGLVSHYWVQKMRTQWGPDSFLYQALVKGRFPTVSDDNLLSWEECQAAMQAGTVAPGKKVIAIDVARYGTCETCLYTFYGGALIAKKEFQGYDLMKTAKTAQALAETHNLTERDEIVVDEVGVGGGVVDRLREMKGDRKLRPNVYGFVSQSVDDLREPNNFASLRDEAYWHMRSLVQAKAATFPNDDVLLNQATSIKYTVDPRTKKIKVESKEDMRKRKLPSPDRLDAYVMGLYRSVSQLFGMVRREFDLVKDVILGGDRESTHYVTETY